VTLITKLDKTVAVTVQTRAATPPQHAFKVNVPIDLSLVFKGWGPFPAVVGVQNQTGAWDHVGASRNPVLSDQTTANETLTEYTVGHSFACEVTGFTNILGRLVEGVRGEWTFTPEGTVIRWTYEFKPRRGRYFLV
jgi:Polyketide cyclase / dehydrase and lipid transport